jgi:hypothetical protein
MTMKNGQGRDGGRSGGGNMTMIDARNTMGSCFFLGSVRLNNQDRAMAIADCGRGL